MKAIIPSRKPAAEVRVPATEPPDEWSIALNSRDDRGLSPPLPPYPPRVHHALLRLSTDHLPPSSPAHRGARSLIPAIPHPYDDSD